MRKKLKCKPKQRIVAILHNIRSAHNVGSIFRTADGAAIRALYLTGYTPAPTDQFGRVNKDIAKTALGAERSVPWKKTKSFRLLFRHLRSEGYYVCAIEQSPRSISYTHPPISSKIALIFGNEVRGLSQSILRRADCVLEIPMRGKKESLNVGAAFAIVAYSFSEKFYKPLH